MPQIMVDRAELNVLLRERSKFRKIIVDYHDIIEKQVLRERVAKNVKFTKKNKKDKKHNNDTD